MEGILWSSVGPERHYEVVQPVAGVVGCDDDTAIRPLVVLSPLVVAVGTRLHNIAPQKSSSAAAAAAADAEAEAKAAAAATYSSVQYSVTLALHG